MSNTDRLFKLAERFARKVSLAQQSAQSGELENVLKDAGVWGSPNDLFPLADEAEIPGGVPITFAIVVDSGLNVSFKLDTEPRHGQPAPPPPPASQVPPAKLIKMFKLMKDKFGPGMSQALKSGKIKEYDNKGNVTSQRPVTVSGTVTIGWHQIK